MEITNETVCIITGASSGIGRALALQLAGRGARVALVARRAELLDTLLEEIEASGGTGLVLPCDVTVSAELERAVAATIEHFGRLDILVNNAGRGHFGYIDDTPEEQIESIFRLNVFSLWYGTAPAIRWMKKQGSGMIINVSSIAGLIGFPGNAAYVAAKHAVIGFNRALRSELAGTGIEAMVVMPAGVATGWAEATEGGSMLEIFGYEKERGDTIALELGVEPLPSLPLLSPEEVARAIVEAIRNPVPELHTHPGAESLVALVHGDPLAAEARQQPYWLANREGYRMIRGGEG